MTIDEAIRHCEEVAERYETRAKIIDRRKLGFALENPTTCHECAAEHRQLAEWLKELKESKKLLKMAVEDLSNNAAEIYNGGVFCKSCKWFAMNGFCKCPHDGGCDIVYRWRYLEGALKLIKEE